MSSPTLITESDQIKVLHIDDDKNQLEFLSLFLSSSDNLISVTSTTDPTAAIKYLETEHFDCVVTDFSMPQLNGIDLSKKIRAISTIPIIIYTGQGSEEVAEAAFLVGIDDYLRKEMDPSHYQVLAKRVKQIVEKRRTETLYQTVVEETRDALSIIFNDIIIYANQSATMLHGFNSVDQLIGSKSTSYILPKDREKVQMHMDSILQDKRTQSFVELSLQRRDGKKIIVDASFSKINYNGNDGLLCFSRDITDRRQLEIEKAESQERYRTLIESTPDGILTMNMKGYVSSVNKAFIELSGFSEDEILGVHFLKLKTLRKQDLKTYLRLFTEFLKGKAPPVFDFQYNRKDGTTGWGEAHLSMIDLLGKKEFLCIAREVSHKKRLEEVFDEYTKQGAGKDNTQYADASYVGDVFSLVGEDLLNPVVDLMNLVHHAKSNPEQINYILPNMEQKISDYVQLIDSLNSRFDNRQTRIQQVDVKTLFNEVIVDANIPEHIKVNFKCKDNQIGYFDQNKIRQVLFNILINSKESIQNNGIISISVEVPNGHIVIQIADNGDGFDDAIKNNLFKPFVTTKEHGTGLGLFYCKKVVEEHRGSINVHSEKFKGTIITIILPQHSYESDILTIPTQKQVSNSTNIVQSF